jgi:hypothetical protein
MSARVLLSSRLPDRLAADCTLLGRNPAGTFRIV